jgi:murein DD-endopeptidase MepM/ murein hydrolase activator NlpD
VVADLEGHPELTETAALLSGLREQTEVLGAFLREVQFFEGQHLDQVRTTPSASPLRDDFLLTSPFGQRRNPFTSRSDFHAGIDLSAQRGTPVYAPAAGRVAFAGRYNARRNVAWWRYGNLVSLRHGDDFVTLFGHLDQVKVKAGQVVEQGQLIGLVGNTGWSTNPHLHYEVRRRDATGDLRPVDPRVYILDHRWRDEEQLLVRARSAPDIGTYEPLPSLIGK